MTSTLSVTPIGVFTQNYLVAHVDSIIAFAKATGVPAVAIAGAADEEMRNVYTDQIDQKTYAGNRADNERPNARGRGKI